MAPQDLTIPPEYEPDAGNSADRVEDAAEKLVRSLYRFVLRRTPSELECRQWVEHVHNTGDAPDVLLELFGSSEEFREKSRIKPFFPDGHPNSPVVDPTTIGKYLERTRPASPSDLAGIPLDVAAMRALWLEHLDAVRSTPFRLHSSRFHRYHTDNASYPVGDAIGLRMLFAHLRPRRVIALGFGDSSACILDCAEHARLRDFALTCIDPAPHPDRPWLRPRDAANVTLMAAEIQTLSLESFAELNPADVLFIDSSHVLKTGSDVHHLLFHILPVLKPGVVLHIHDVPWPFEYDDAWIFRDNYSWNEAYAVRAFLMYNNRFRVLFWNSLFATRYAAELETEHPQFVSCPGSGLWIERVE